MPSGVRRRSSPCRRAAARAVLAAAAVVAGACNGATGVMGDGTLRVRATRDSLRVENRSDAPVFTTVIGVETLPLVDWYPCLDADRCPPIPAGGVRSVGRPTTVRLTPEREAVVYWWRSAPYPTRVPPNTSLARPDSVRELRVRFPFP